MNYYGIGQVRSPTIQLDAYVSLLSNAMYCPLDRPQGQPEWPNNLSRRYWDEAHIQSDDGEYHFWDRQVSILYGLLRESPGIWSKPKWW